MLYNYKIVEKVSKKVLDSSIATRKTAREEMRVWKSEGFKVNIVQEKYQLQTNKIIR